MSKRFLDRAKPALRRYEKVLTAARDRDANESDTCAIITDMLTEILGYKAYDEVTSEFAVKGTYCDLAIRRGNKPLYLIEVKAIGSDLRDNHLRQATDYGAREGIEWIILTNGAVWQVHRIRFDQPVSHEELFTIDLLDPDAKSGDLLDRLYLLSREAAGGSAIDGAWEHREATNRYVVAQLLLTEDVLSYLRRNLRRLFDGVAISPEEIGDLLEREVIKREVLEGDRAESARRRVRRAARRHARELAAENGPSGDQRVLPVAQSADVSAGQNVAPA